MSTFSQNPLRLFFVLFASLFVGFMIAGWLHLSNRADTAGAIAFVYEAGGNAGIYGVAPGSNNRLTFVAVAPVNTWMDSAFDMAPAPVRRLSRSVSRNLPHNPVWLGNGRILAYKNYRYDRACEEIIWMDIVADETKSIACLHLDAHDQTLDWRSDGRYVAFVERESTTIKIVDAQSGEIQYLYPPAPVRGLAWSPDGTQFAVVVAADPSLYVYGLDGSEAVWETAVPASGKPTWSPDGQSIAYFCYAAEKINICASHSQFSKPSYFTFGNQFPYLKYNLQWSPDGQKLLFEAQQRGGGNDIFLMNPDGSGLQQLTFHPSDDLEPVWSPDGRQIAFISLRDGNKEIYTIGIDGTGLTRLTETPGDETELTWKP